MNKLFTALTAAAIGFGTFAATEASAQSSRTTVVERHTTERHMNRHKRSRRVCNTVVRNHHKVRQCRTVWR